MTEFWHSQFETSIKHQKITVDVSECVFSDTGIYGSQETRTVYVKEVKEIKYRTGAISINTD